MQVRIENPRVTCHAITDPKTNADEVYLGCFVSAARVVDGKVEVKTLLGRGISAVQREIWAGSSWTAEGLSFEVDATDAETLHVAYVLFEEDDGKLYRRLVREIATAPEEGSFTWKDSPFKQAEPHKREWWEEVFGFFVDMLEDWIADDHHGHRTMIIPSDQIGQHQEPKVFHWRRFRSHYEVETQLTVV